MDGRPARGAANEFKIGKILRLLLLFIEIFSDSSDYFFGGHFHFKLLNEQIMGLNLPFGVKAAVANEIIDKALEFKPKLILLMLPRDEAQR